MLCHRTFSDKMLQANYDNARKLAADNFSDFYYGAGLMGPRYPRRGAGHRCYYWNGYTGTGIKPMRSWLGYAYWAAGHDDARAANILARRAAG